MKLTVVHCLRIQFSNQNLHRLKLQEFLIQVATIMYIERTCRLRFNLLHDEQERLKEHE